VIDVLVNFYESEEQTMVGLQNGDLELAIAKTASTLNIDIKSYIDDKGNFDTTSFFKTVHDLTEE
jgi:hypothetical protein